MLVRINATEQKQVGICPVASEFVISLSTMTRKRGIRYAFCFKRADLEAREFASWEELRFGLGRDLETLRHFALHA